MQPFISICIAAYNRTSFLKRLLDSVHIQTFKNFEVIVTDDSPGAEVEEVCKQYESNFKLLYKKNVPALGTPANWNEAIKHANGEWIKLMHDDDWFANEHSLELFAKETAQNKKFIFSAYDNVFENNGSTEKKLFPAHWRQRIIKNPVTLLNTNVIGPPSVTLIHRSITEQYDTNMKWRVDIDFYIRLLKIEQTFSYINTPLINVGISDSQVTNSCINKPEVELPEGLLLLIKYDVAPLKNILVYDAWWRIIRNVGVRGRKDIEHYTMHQQWPAVILSMVDQQSKILPSVLKIGVFSKFFMFLSYLANQRYLKQYN
jgi:glycosyltransferase involved in cell wall biosynthesis